MYFIPSLKNEIKRCGILKHMCSVVQQCDLTDELLYYFVDSFTFLITNNSENCEELYWENGVTYLLKKLQVTPPHSRWYPPPSTCRSGAS